MALYLQATVVTYVSMFADNVSALADKLNRDERGQDTLEWTMISGLMAVALLVLAGIFTTALTSFANGVKNCVDFNAATTCVAGL